MLSQVVTLLNWVLAVLMWLVIGRAVLDTLTRGRQTVIGRLFHLLTDPLYRPLRSLMPRASPFAIALVLVILFLSLRILLVFSMAAIG